MEGKYFPLLEKWIRNYNTSSLWNYATVKANKQVHLSGLDRAFKTSIRQRARGDGSPGKSTCHAS